MSNPPIDIALTLCTPMVKTFLANTQALDKELREKGWLDTKDTWPTTAAGQRLCEEALEAWTQTHAWWTNTDNTQAWDATDILTQCVNSMTFFNALCNDYVYRTNATVPSAPLWDFMERHADMPTQWSEIQHVIARLSRHSTNKLGTIALDQLNRRLTLTALCRHPHPYALVDTPESATLWEDAQELRFFWHRQNDGGALQHQQVVRAFTDLPASRASFYKRAAANTIPEKTALHVLAHDAMDITDIGNDATLVPWSNWLASLQDTSVVWTDAQQRWPAFTHTLTLVKSIGLPGDVGANALAFYRQGLQADVQPLDPLALFEAAP